MASTSPRTQAAIASAPGTGGPGGSGKVSVIGAPSWKRSVTVSVSASRRFVSGARQARRSAASRPPSMARSAGVSGRPSGLSALRNVAAPPVTVTSPQGRFPIATEQRGGALAGELAEDGDAGEAGAERVVDEEQAAHDLAGGEQARDRPVDAVEHLGVGADPDAAEGEGDAAGHRIGAQWRRLD